MAARGAALVDHAPAPDLLAIGVRGWGCMYVRMCGCESRQSRCPGEQQSKNVAVCFSDTIPQVCFCALIGDAYVLFANDPYIFVRQVASYSRKSLPLHAYETSAVVYT